MSDDASLYGNEVGTEFGYAILDGAQHSSTIDQIKKKGYYQMTEKELRTKLPFLEGKTVVDAYAGIGYWTLLLSKVVGPEGTVISIEPTPWNFSVLVENITRCKWATNVIVLHNALTEETYKDNLPMYYNPDDAVNNSLVKFENGDAGEELVVCKKLDDIIEDSDAPYLMNFNIPNAKDLERAIAGGELTIKIHTPYIISQGNIIIDKPSVN